MLKCMSLNDLNTTNNCYKTNDKCYFPYNIPEKSADVLQQVKISQEI